MTRSLIAAVAFMVGLSAPAVLATNYSTPLSADEALYDSDCVFAPSDSVGLCLNPTYSLLNLTNYLDAEEPYFIWGSNADENWPWGNGTHEGQTSFPSGGYAYMQADGNFVLYDSGNDPLWETFTWGYSGAYLEVQDDDNLVVYSSSQVPLWSIF